MAAIACNLDHVLVRRVAAMIAAIIVIAGNGTPTALVFTPAIIFISHLVYLPKFEILRIANKSASLRPSLMSFHNIQIISKQIDCDKIF